MFNSRRIFGIILFCLFIYLFGFSAICKYLRRSTIVIQTIEKTSDIQAPAITIVPFWKGEGPVIYPCEMADHLYDCLEENFTLPIEEIVVDSTSFNWTSRFEPSQSMLFTLNPSDIKLSSKEALFIEECEESFPKLPAGDLFIPDPQYLPRLYLHDPKYFVFSTNPKYRAEHFIVIIYAF